MATIDPVIVKIQADVSDLKAGLDRAQASLRGLDDTVKKADTGFGSFASRLKGVAATIGATFVATQLVSFFKDSVSAAMEAESAQVRLREILLNTNGATLEQVAALEAQQEALAKVGFASKDNISIAQSQLATFDLTAKTISTLTPAILDYVAAEKGAAATTEDYKMMTNGLAQALQGNFASLTRVGFVLDEATKKTIANGTEAQRAAALVKVLNSTYEGFNETLLDTPEGRMMKLGQEFNDLKQIVGEALLPVMEVFMDFLRSTIIPVLRRVAEGFKALTGSLVGPDGLGGAFTKVKDEIVSFFTPLAEMTKEIMGPGSLGESFKNVAKSIKEFFIPILQALKSAFTTIRQAILDNKKRFQEILATFKEIWSWVSANLIPLFRTALVSAIQFSGWWISNIIKVIVPVIEFVVKSIKGLINMVIIYVNALISAYNKVNVIWGGEDVKKLKLIGEGAKTSAKDLENLGIAAEETNKKIKDLGSGGGGGGRVGGGGLDKKTLDKIKDYNTKVRDLEKSYMEDAKDLQERFFDEMSELQERFQERIEELKTRKERQDASARKAHAKRLIDISKNYAKQEIQIAERLQEQKDELAKKAEADRVSLRQRAVEKEISITQQSMDRLRSAFASGLNFNLENILQRGGGITGAIRRITKSLQEAKDLQANAAALAGRGYSQTFIEEIVKAGPRVGNRMAKSILAASPESTKELQSLFGQIEKISDSGLDSLAETMNKGGNLATRELREAYANVATDLQKSLVEVDVALKEGLAQAQKDYDKAMAETAKARAEAMLEASEDLQERLDENTQQLREALNDSYKDFQKSQKDIYDEFTKDLADSYDDLLEALKKARKAFKEAVEDTPGVKIPKVNPIAPYVPNYGGFTPSDETTVTTPVAPVTNNNINVTATTEADPISIADAILYAQKYGQVIQVRDLAIR